MGLYDSVFVEEVVAKDNDICCPECGKSLHEEEWQTKSFENCMDHYYLAYDEQKRVHLYSLDPPDKEKFWIEYSDEQIEDANKHVKDKRFLYTKGEGTWREGAWLPKNRYKRYMGELPHQCCEFLSTCNNCIIFVCIEAKFTDGVLVYLRKKA